jgi:hypothetical protein
VDDITQIEKFHNFNRDFKAENIIKETTILTIARLAKILVDLFGSDDAFKRIGEKAGQEIEIFFKELNGYITFILTSEKDNFDCYVGKAKNPISKVIIAVKKDKILQVFSKIVRSKNNILSLIKLLKYFILSKIKIKGSYLTALKWARCIMIGNHSVYKNDK